MRRSKSLLVRLCIAALVSGLAALLMVTVGPGFAEKPDDMGPNEHAAEQAQENSAEEEEAPDEEAGDGSSGAVSTDEDSSDGSASERAEVAAETNGAKPDGPPGQTTPEGGDSGLIGVAAGNSENSASANGNPKPNEDTSQTGLPRGQSEDDCTNKHQGANSPQGGANQNPGPYDNTCDGRASENGSGGGKASGRPCMGCVGNADDMNPRGQLPNGKDHNAGYECDRNKGVGQGNPAHTDCQPRPPCQDNPNTPADECDEEEPPCVDKPQTPKDECDEEEPPCVDKPQTPKDECDEEEPPCVDKPQTPKDECDEEEPPCVDKTQTPKDECDEDVVSICYQLSNGDWRVAEDIEEDDVDSYRNARVVPKGTDADDCEDTEEVCPEGTDRAGMPNPSGDPDDCDIADERFCPDDTELAGRPMPADGNCNPTRVIVCPVTSDKALRPVPDGRTMAWCDLDEVEGEIIRRIPVPAQPQPNVQGKVVRPEGGILPFTGASILAFLVLALQLIAAGSLILRGRRA